MVIDNHLLRTAYKVTFHCMLGCVIGEFIGLSVGVSFSWTPLMITISSTFNAFICGILLAIIPIMRKHHISYICAIKIVWFGEAISISVMEITMNGVDYYMGGMNVSSVINVVFWNSLIMAIISGYFTVLPINYWLLKKHFKKCHA
ncbi:MAG: DUF4396 domain-containing protein [Legionellales bacterium]|nr:DUF4396 domain-containing protein [Legionellales bacterium]